MKKSVCVNLVLTRKRQSTVSPAEYRNIVGSYMDPVCEALPHTGSRIRPHSEGRNRALRAGDLISGLTWGELLCAPACEPLTGLKVICSLLYTLYLKLNHILWRITEERRKLLFLFYSSWFLLLVFCIHINRITDLDLLIITGNEFWKLGFEASLQLVCLRYLPPCQHKDLVLWDMLLAPPAVYCKSL